MDLGRDCKKRDLGYKGLNPVNTRVSTINLWNLHINFSRYFVWNNTLIREMYDVMFVLHIML